MIEKIISEYSCFGFGGSRAPDGLIPPRELFRAIAAIPSSAPVLVGCAKGIDALVRLAFKVEVPASSLVSQASVSGIARFGPVSVFVADSPAFGGCRPARSLACVRSVGTSGLWLCFPAHQCPNGLMPSSRGSRCFAGYKSGSWSAIAFALGSGLACLVFSPGGVPSDWGLSAVDGSPGWFFREGVRQLSLF